MDLFINEKNEQRKRDAYLGIRPDRVPVDFSDQLDFLNGWKDLDCQKFHLDGAEMLKYQIDFNKRFGGGGILGPNFGVALEASAFKADILFTKENPPWVIEPCKNYDDLDDYVDQLEDPHPLFSGHLPLFYQTFNYMNSLAGGTLSAPLGCIASIDVATLLVGMENFSIAMKLNPETIHKLLKKINKFLINFIEARIEYFGVKSVEMLDLYGDNTGYISPDDFLEFVAPYNKEIYDYFSTDKTVKLFHCDGKLEQHVKILPEMGCNCLYSFDPTANLEMFVEELGDKLCLVGNLDPIQVLRNETPENVREEVKRIVTIGKKAKSFVLCTGGELANGTPPENIDVLLETLDEFGAY